MKEIRDNKGKLIAMGNPDTGEVEVVYKHHRVFLTLPIGASFSVDREGKYIATVVRIDEGFAVENYI